MKVIWVDDDIHRFTLRAYVDELEDRGIEVIKISDPDAFIEDIIESPDKEAHDCLVMDIMMPSGQRLNSKETNSGFETGFKLIELYREVFPLGSIIVFSIVGGDKVKKTSSDLNAQHASKKTKNPEDFFNLIMHHHDTQ